MPTINFRCTESRMKAIREAAGRERCSMNGLLNRAVADYLDLPPSPQGERDAMVFDGPGLAGTEWVIEEIDRACAPLEERLAKIEDMARAQGAPI